MVLGLKQLKLAAGILAGLAKAGDQAGIATAIDLALKATDFGETLRKQDPVAVALRDVSAKLEEATRKALSGEFSADWESKPDLAATLAALPHVLEYYAPDTDAIFVENLDAERIARRATDADCCPGTLLTFGRGSISASLPERHSQAAQLRLKPDAYLGRKPAHAGNRFLTKGCVTTRWQTTSFESGLSFPASACRRSTLAHASRGSQLGLLC